MFNLQYDFFLLSQQKHRIYVNRHQEYYRAGPPSAFEIPVSAPTDMYLEIVKSILFYFVHVITICPFLTTFRTCQFWKRNCRNRREFHLYR